MLFILLSGFALLHATCETDAKEQRRLKLKLGICFCGVWGSFAVLGCGCFGCYQIQSFFLGDILELLWMATKDMGGYFHRGYCERLYLHAFASGGQLLAGPRFDYAYTSDASLHPMRLQWFHVLVYSWGLRFQPY